MDLIHRIAEMFRETFHREPYPVTPFGRDVEMSRQDQSETHPAKRTEPFAGRLNLELQAKDKKLRELQKELQELQEAHYALLRLYNGQAVELTSVAERKADGERSLLALRTSAEAFKRELQACKDDLFRLQPIVQMSDAEVVGLYETVSQQISHWIDEEFLQLERCNTQETGSTTQLISDGGSLEVANFLRKYPAAAEYLVSSMIHMYLQDMVLGKHVYFLGLDGDTSNFLQEIEHSMAGLSPSRDTKTISNWRSETLKAVAEIPTVLEERKRQVLDITDNLLLVLCSILPTIQGNQASLMRLHEEVVLPAVKLSLAIKHSSTQYEFSPRVTSFPSFTNEPVVLEHLSCLTTIDVSSRKTLKPHSPVIVLEDGNIGRTILLLEPGLCRINREAEGNKSLRHPVCLIELAKPMKKQNKGFIRGRI